MSDEMKNELASVRFRLKEANDTLGPVIDENEELEAEAAELRFGVGAMGEVVDALFTWMKTFGPWNDGDPHHVGEGGPLGNLYNAGVRWVRSVKLSNLIDPVERAERFRDHVDRKMLAGSSENWWERQVRESFDELIEALKQRRDIEDQMPDRGPK